MNKIETSIRFSAGTLERLKDIAHVRSLETGRTVTWNGLVREVVELMRGVASTGGIQLSLLATLAALGLSIRETPTARKPLNGSF